MVKRKREQFKRFLIGTKDGGEMRRYSRASKLKINFYHELTIIMNVVPYEIHTIMSHGVRKRYVYNIT